MMNKGKIIGAVAAVFVASSSLAWAQVATYTVFESGHLRTFDFDGSTPFQNPNTGQGDAATWQWNGLGRSSHLMTNAGISPDHITKVMDTFMDGDTQVTEQVTRVALLSTDTNTAGMTAWRTQLNSYGIEPGKRYVLDLEFKLDNSWKFESTEGTGLLWQLKGIVAGSHQWPNPVLALTLHGNQLKFVIAYPKSAKSATTWPTTVSWTSNGYDAISIPTRTIEKNKYYKVQLTFFADDKPASFNNGMPGGNGFVSARFNDQPWFDYTGGTLHPDGEIDPATGDYKRHQLKWGWYQWDTDPISNRIVYYRKLHLSESK